MDLDPKGANNQIKEAIDKRYVNEEDDPNLSGQYAVIFAWASPGLLGIRVIVWWLIDVLNAKD